MTMRVMKPARKAATSKVPTVQTKILRLTMMQPRSTYFFFFCSPEGPSNQLCWVSSNGRDESAARSKSCRFRLRSSSVAESAVLISSGPPHGSLPYILIFSKSLSYLVSSFCYSSDLYSKWRLFSDYRQNPKWFETEVGEGTRLRSEWGRERWKNKKVRRKKKVSVGDCWWTCVMRESKMKGAKSI